MAEPTTGSAAQDLSSDGPARPPPTARTVRQLDQEVSRLSELVKQLTGRLEDLTWKLDRHQKRLESIEDHPPFPLEQPTRHYATETQSVSMARRKRLGHLG